VTVVLVALAAAVGAPLRYLTDRAVQSRHDSVFPWGTLIVNVVGSLLLGALVAAGQAGHVPAVVVTVVGVGFCGALTTYSAFAYETVRLARSGSALSACLNAGISLCAGLGAAFLAFGVVSTAWP
jgi:CrcB protein